MDQVRAWKPAVPGIVEVFHARFAEYAYPAHSHRTWTVFLVDDGVIRYDLDRHSHGSDSTVVSVLPPHVVHDGRPATSRGFRKRVLYVDESVLGEHLVGPAVDRPVIVDRLLRDRLSVAHKVLRSGDALEAESRLAFVFERLRRHLNERPEPARDSGNVLAEQLRALLDEHVTGSLTLAAAGRRLGAHPAHLVRSFTGAYGIAPHAYLLSRRIELARRRLLDGEPPAEVAVGVGFYDQAHFTRHFKRYAGTTPGRFGGSANIDTPAVKESGG